MGFFVIKYVFFLTDCKPVSVDLGLCLGALDVKGNATYTPLNGVPGCLFTRPCNRMLWFCFVFLLWWEGWGGYNHHFL